MKKIIPAILFFLFTGFTGIAQNWDWARSGTGGAGSAYYTTTDPSGNVYIVGNYDALHITFGSETLNYAGQSDAYLVKYDANGNVLWARNIGGVCDDYVTGIATDGNGNVFVTGFFCSATLSLGSVTLTGYGGSFNIFVAKYDPAGNVLWARTGTGTTTCNNYSHAVAVDNNGNVFITGMFTSATLTFDSYVLVNGGTPGATTNIFLAKFDNNGNLSWAKKAGEANDARAFSIATDPNGNAYITGWFRVAANFDAITLSSTGNTDFFLTKYNPAGNVVWAKSTTCVLDDGGNSVSVDPSGNIYITGSFASPSIVFGSVTLTNSNPPGSTYHNNIFLVKYDSSGNVSWAKSAGGTSNGGNDIGYAVSAYNGGVYVSGGFDSPVMQMGSYTLDPVQTGNNPMFIANYNASGDVVYATFLEDGGAIRNSLSTDMLGNLYVTASFRFNASPFTIGSQVFNTVGINTAFLAKLGSAFVLPVNLSGFNVTPSGRKLLLQWDVEAEMNTDTYDVQRSSSSTGNYETIGRVSATGNGQHRHYSYEDYNVRPGVLYYYRIAISEPGTTLRYTAIRTGKIPEADPPSVTCTNPVTGTVDLHLHDINGLVQVRVVNDKGQVVLSKQINTFSGNTVSLNLRNMAAGIYWIHLQTNSGEIVKKITRL